MRHVLLVGATDGIGLALAREYLARRWRVAVLGRDPEKLDRVVRQLRSEAPRADLSGVVCDVTDAERVEPAFEEALRALGQLDLMLYCAGIMATGRTAGERANAARAMLDVNATGAARFLELGAAYLAAAGRGHLAGLGSVAGDRGRRGNPGYGASKAALHTYLEGLRHRLHGSGVTVSTVKPGWVRTRMLGEDRPAAISPESAAAKIADGLERGREVFYVPAWWRAVGLALRWMPSFLFKRIGPA